MNREADMLNIAPVVHSDPDILGGTSSLDGGMLRSRDIE